MKTTTLIVGCGDIGITLGRELLASGHRVIGARRRPERLADSGIEGVKVDLADPETLAELPDADILVYVVSADRFEEEAYRAAYPEGLKAVLATMATRDKAPRHVFFVSSTSVYAQRDGEVVDETSPAEPTGFSGVLMREAEQALIEHDLPGSVVRFSGIYGPGRDRLIRQVGEGRIAPASPTMYSNRIHRDDCAGVLAHLIGKALEGATLEPLYLASDTEPAPLNEVMTWLAKQLKVECTETIQSPLRRRASKRCDSSLLIDSGYRFRYPTFRDGYTQVLKEGGFLKAGVVE
ncbi:MULTISPECIES: SDR family oxidoreductase [Halomonas]|uniref:SDR family oxidoreductase n=2 Tax=Halomonas TaxID=2745 RepID=A0AAU7KUK7_9GAMM|nr:MULTISPECIES: SDR family oxidoreductase [Halomonas]MBR9772397.1 SDR family oxidoreductase [Gammaproteobacteria bacterium]MAR74737.1 NAD(P)-dependent oxidoreductase [Halomonas sp.]MAY70570.1 NAD(P)-dependent oxidoreductase [Halomonas sp.]MBS8269729.1 SDR family oxidoreductase [Halomonas litopenaei]MCJ8284936.1 SDR family oxidoreductase [Halomonas sp.]